MKFYRYNNCHNTLTKIRLRPEYREPQLEDNPDVNTIISSNNWKIKSSPKTDNINIDCKKSEPYIYCVRCRCNGFPDEVIYFKAGDTKSDTNKIINWTLFDDPELTQKHIHRVRTKGLIISPNGQQPTEYLVKYLDTIGPAITKKLSLVQKTHDIVQNSSVKEMEDEENSD